MSIKTIFACGLAISLILVIPASAGAKSKKKKDKTAKTDPYAELVWPPPPDEPRIKLETVVSSRADVGTEEDPHRSVAAGPLRPARQAYGGGL